MRVVDVRTFQIVSFLWMREEKVFEFINIYQGNMSVKDYTLKFIRLAKYGRYVVVNSTARMSMLMWVCRSWLSKNFIPTYWSKKWIFFVRLYIPKNIDKENLKEREKRGKDQ